MNKKALRNVLRLKRKSIPAKERQKLDRSIEKKLKDLQSFRKSLTIGFYLSNDEEVSTNFLLKGRLYNKKFVVPIIRNKKMHLCRIIASSKFSKATFGIREPINAKIFKNLKKIDLFLVPGIGFDLSGHRIGYGGGFFDKLLPKLNCTTIGLAYELQIVDKVPVKKYDVPVSYILTEKRLIICKHSHQ